MTKKRTFEDDLLSLAALADADIDTSDIPETVDFHGARRARYYPFTQRKYDIRAIANWCIDKAVSEGRAIGTLWLNKIVPFIYEEAIQKSGVVLSGARLEAWKHGPVFREIFFDDKIEKAANHFTKFNPKTRKMEVAREDFLPEDLSLFEDAWKRLGHKSGTELRALAHSEGGAWHKVWTEEGAGNLGLHIDIATILAAKATAHGRKRAKD